MTIKNKALGILKKKLQKVKNAIVLFVFCDNKPMIKVELVWIACLP